MLRVVECALFFSSADFGLVGVYLDCDESICYAGMKLDGQILLSKLF